MTAFAYGSDPEHNPTPEHGLIRTVAGYYHLSACHEIA